jgi:lycopene beta-cyclase
LELYGSPIISSLYPSRFDTYDGVLLQVLLNRKITGEGVFSTLFEKNEIQQVLKFLDNETSLAEEFHIFASLNKTEFAKAFLKRQFKFKPHRHIDKIANI